MKLKRIIGDLKRKKTAARFLIIKGKPSKAVKDRRDGSKICCDGLVVPCNSIQGIIVAQGQKGKEIEMMKECIYDRGSERLFFPVAGGHRENRNDSVKTRITQASLFLGGGSPNAGPFSERHRRIPKTRSGG